MWKVVTNYNLNSPLKLSFFSPILTNNNLLLKIYCENIVKILWSNFLIRIFYFLYYFLFFHFILLHTRVLYPPSFISFSPFLLQILPATSHLLLCSSKKKKKIVLLIGEKTETETERKEKDWERSAWPPPHASPLPLQHLHRQAGSDRLVFFFFFHTCLFWFKFILRIGFCFVVCVLCLD